MHIFAFDTNLQYFAFSYILIICSLHLHKFLYDYQVHNILTCVNTLHFSESIFFFILCVWRFAWCRSWGVWYIVYPTRFGIYPTRIINLPFSVLFDSHFFNQPSHPIPLWKKCTSVILSLFQSFIPPYPTQSNFWNNFAVQVDFHFFNHPSHPIPLLKMFCISVYRQMAIWGAGRNVGWGAPKIWTLLERGEGIFTLVKICWCRSYLFLAA